MIIRNLFICNLQTDQKVNQLINLPSLSLTEMQFRDD